MAFLVKRGKKGIWYVRYLVNGKVCWISTRSTNKKTAQEILKQYQGREAEEFHDLRRKRITLGEFFKRYMEFCETSQAPRWAKNKRLLFENRLIPFFGPDTPLKEITTARIEIYRAKRKKEVAGREVNIETHHALLPLLRKAVEWGELDSNHFPIVKKLPEFKGRLRFLSLEEIPLLLEAARGHGPGMETYVRLMLYAGLRSGEALALRWQDVDLGRKLFHIMPRADWTPKSKKGRVVPMPRELFEFLARRRAEIPEAVLVVEGESTPYMLKRHFRRVVTAAGLPVDGEEAVTAHTCRHSFGSHLAMKGIPLFTIGALMGHSGAEVTKIYAHLAPGHLADAAAHLEFGNGGGDPVPALDLDEIDGLNPEAKP